MILSVVHASRSLRQTHQISALHKLPFFIWTSLAKHIQPDSPLSRYAQDIKAFTNASQLTLVAEEVSQLYQPK
jgi:valyl-tRNA synthetase